MFRRQFKATSAKVRMCQRSPECVAETFGIVGYTSECICHSSDTFADAPKRVGDTSGIVVDTFEVSPKLPWESPTLSDTCEGVVDSVGSVGKCVGTVSDTIGRIGDRSECVADSSRGIAETFGGVADTYRGVADASDIFLSVGDTSECCRRLFRKVSAKRTIALPSPAMFSCHSANDSVPLNH